MSAAAPVLGQVLELCPPDDEPDGEPSVLAGGTTVCGATYDPLPKQRAFHDSSERYKAFIGGLGAGKTLAGTDEALQRSVLINADRPHVGLVCALTYPHLRDTVLPVFEAVFGSELTRSCLAGGSWRTAFSKNSMSLRLWNGTIILFRTTHNRNYEKFRGLQLGWFYMDEASQIPDDKPWKVAIGRLRYPGVRYRGGWLTTTPDGENWVWEWFMARPREGYAWFHSPTYDNHHLPADYVASLDADYSEEDKAQELRAEVVSRRGAVYKDLSHEEWPKGNVLTYAPPPGAQVHLEVDFGYRSPRCHAIQRLEVQASPGQPPRKLDCVVWEWQETNGGPPKDRTIHDMVLAIQASGLTVVKNFGDPAGDSANSQSHLTDAEYLRRATGVGFISPREEWQRSIENGERAVRARIRDGAGDRHLVWAARAGKLDELGRPCLLAPNSFRALRNFRFPDAKDDQAQKDVGLKDGINDHDTDAVRYRCVMLYGRARKRRVIETMPTSA